MHGWGHEAAARKLPVAALLCPSTDVIGLLYLASYALLDWLSFISPIAPVGVTPWNPATGLSFALVLLLGREYVPWLFLAPLVTSTLVLDLPMPIVVHVLGAAIVGTGYGLATSALEIMPRLAFDRTLSTKSPLAVLLITVALVSTGTVSRLPASACSLPSAWCRAGSS